MIQDGIDYGEGYEKATEPGPAVEFWTGENWIPRYDYKEIFSSVYKYRQPIKEKYITTEDKMNETFIAVKVTNPMVYGLHVTLAEAERLGEEAKRIKAENEIKAGDWFIDNLDKAIRLCIRKTIGRVWYCCGGTENWMSESNTKKICYPDKSVREIYEGMK